MAGCTMDKDADIEVFTPQSLVTENHVEKALQADKGPLAQLISWRIVNFTNRGDNYATFVTSVEVKYSSFDDVKNVTYIAKINRYPDKEANALYEIIYAKETLFYMKLLPSLNSVLRELRQEPLRFPPCFHSSLELEKQQIYLGDMRQHGFRMLDARKGMNVAHASLVFKELGRFHATSLLLEDRMGKPLELQFDLIKEDIFNRHGQAMGPILGNFFQISTKVLENAKGYQRAFLWISSLKLRFGHLLTKGLQSDRFNVLNHGDCWNNNILFRYDDEGEPEDAMLVDFQLLRKCSLAIDLNFLFYTSLTEDTRKENLNDLLSVYYSSFKEVLETGDREMFFTKDELLKEFRNKNTFGALIAMMMIPGILQEESTSNLTEISSDDIHVAAAKLRTKTLKHIHRDTLMTKRILSVFDELMEIGLIP